MKPEASTAGPVLITGCSTGIGRATAERMARNGHLVYATARRPESIEDLEKLGCRTLRLDVTDEDSMQAAVDAVETEHGSIGALVNNAGYGLHGAVESMSIADARRQFETNFFGPVRLTQMALPGMRRRGKGRIVNISSMGGKVTFPGGGFYHATKHALEALSDALRFEVKPFGIDVVVVEPGLVQTSFGDTAVGTIDAGDADAPYDEFNRGVMHRIHDAYTGAMSRLAVDADSVAKTIEKAATTNRPRTRYAVPAAVGGLVAVARLLPDRAFDVILGTQYEAPKK